MAAQDATVTGRAGRYATALFDLASDQHALDAVRAEVDRCVALLTDNPELTRLERSPVFSSDAQLRAITAVLHSAGLRGLAANFIKLVAQNRRLFAIRDMARAFRTLVARRRGEVTAQVTVAEPLSDVRLAEIRNALREVTGKEDVALEVTVDPAIIGGIVVKLGSRMVDTSLRTKLNAIKHAMKEVG